MCSPRVASTRHHQKMLPSDHSDDLANSFSYRHPSGMLDRDLRTTMSIEWRKIARSPNNIEQRRKRIQKNSNSQNTSSSLCACGNYYLSDASDNQENCTVNHGKFKRKNFNECCFNCNRDMHCDSTRSFYAKDVSGRLSSLTTCCFQCRRDRKDRNAALTAKCCAARYCKGLKSSRTKSSSHFLLLLVFAIVIPLFTALPIAPTTAHRLLLHSQQHRAKQISHHRLNQHHLHHRSINMNCNNNTNNNKNNQNNINNSSNSNGNSKSYCQLVNERLNHTLKQSEMSYSYIRNLMDIYTMAQFKKTPLDVRKLWEEQPLHFNHAIEKYMQEDFDKLPSPLEFEHLSGDPSLSQTELTMEMQKIYLCLNTLKHVFEDITNDRHQNRSQILFDLLGRTKAHAAINNYFTTAHEYIKTDLNEAEIAMQHLNISKPVVGDTTAPTDHTDLQRQNREWLSAKEHLKVLQYIRAIYRYFLDKTCVENDGE